MSVSLIQFLLRLLGDEDAQKDFADDPEGALKDAGLDGICGADIAAAAPLVADDRSVHLRGDGPDHGVAAATPPVHPGPGETEIDVVVKQIQHITKNYVTKDDHSIDNSVKQSIWNSGELELHQVFDNDPTVANGDGSVAAGDDIEGTVTTGNHNTVVSGDENVVGDGNAVGEDNLVNNGDNNATGDGNVTGEFGDGAQVATNGGEIENSIDDSFNTDKSTNDSYNKEIEDSFNTKTEDSYNDNSDNRDQSSTDNRETSVEIEEESTTIRDSYNDESVEQEGLVNVNDTEVALGV
jgi:hypothetical protein